MVAVADLTACRDVTANLILIRMLQTVKFGEGSSDRLKTVLVCSGPTSPGIWLT